MFTTTQLERSRPAIRRSSTRAAHPATDTATSKSTDRLRGLVLRTALGALAAAMLALLSLGVTPLAAHAEVSLAACSTMRAGSTGACVRSLQAALVSRGYVISVDGQYGPQTAGAVMALQRHAPGLVVDGIAGPRTLAYLTQEPSDPPPAPATAPTPPPAAAAAAPKVPFVYDCGIVTCSYYLSRSTTAAFAGWADRNAWVVNAGTGATCYVLTLAASGATVVAGAVTGATCLAVQAVIDKFMGEAKNAAAGHGCLRIRVNRGGMPLMAYNDGGQYCRD